MCRCKIIKQGEASGWRRKRLPDATGGVYYAWIRVADAHGVVDGAHMDEGDLAEVTASEQRCEHWRIEQQHYQQHLIDLVVRQHFIVCGLEVVPHPTGSRDELARHACVKCCLQLLAHVELVCVHTHEVCAAGLQALQPPKLPTSDISSCCVCAPMQYIIG